ncbi:hypothetical protein HELRODRAFT_159569 [Helobdella robusta]|uniref:BET1 homolog n=1 Tax=Helobdella robusta TaxID=6412 RepID=T1EP64_HELRO|nr:hypothetical protein HELRODRAFT_159569 [Helobdella robusta]ESO12975.1 hypothetical protein HELRODRAFT_159569 [Helobdella robusta]
MPSGSNSPFIEEENDQLEKDLKNKVGLLKKVTIDIGHEVREQNKLLKEMDDDFDKSTGFLKSTMARVKKIAKSGHFYIYIYLLLFAAFVFFVIWLIMKTR